MCVTEKEQEINSCNGVAELSTGRWAQPSSANRGNLYWGQDRETAAVGKFTGWNPSSTVPPGGREE